MYTGTLDRKKMSDKERIAYEAFCGLKARSKKQGLPAPTFGAREFMSWWLEGLKTFNGTRPTCGRLDHSRGYTWDNFRMEDMADNSREMAARTLVKYRQQGRGNKVYVFIKGTSQLTGIFPSIRMAAKFFKVSQRKMQFIIREEQRPSKHINFDLRGQP